MNGSPNRKMLDLHIMPLARTAKPSRSTPAENSTSYDGHDSPLENIVEDQVVALYIKASTILQTGKSHSIERQFQSLIHELRDTRLSSIMVLIEDFSSSAHPPADRILAKKLLQSGPQILLTNNPDRLTRRSDEIPDLLDRLNSKQITWFSQGALESRRSWNNMMIENDWVMEHLEVGRAVALQAGFYTRSVQQMSRIISTEKDWSFDTMKNSLHRFALSNNIKNFILVIRVSPPKHSEARPADTQSLERQQTFLTEFLPHNSQVQLIRLQGISAFNGDTLAEISSRIGDLQVPHILLATSVDRVSRNPTYITNFQTLLEAGSHFLVSFLWQCSSIELNPIRLCTRRQFPC